MRTSGHFLYILDCKHVTYRMAVTMRDGGFRCYHCKTPKGIIGVHIYEWHSKCKVPGCPFGRWTGLSENMAREASRKHEGMCNHATDISYEINPASEKELIRLRRHGLLSKPRTDDAT
jgi:hypothetical protein